MKLFKKMKKGFTLVELVVVIAVIAILSAVSVVAYTSITKNARKTTAKSTADQIVNVIKVAVVADAYTEKVDAPTGDNKGPYTVSLVGREIVITKGSADTRTDVQILNDLVSELGENVSLGNFKTEESISYIGVAVASTNPVEYEWSSF